MERLAEFLQSSARTRSAPLWFRSQSWQIATRVSFLLRAVSLFFTVQLH